jgi:hypothetical protein
MDSLVHYEGLFEPDFLWVLRDILFPLAVDFIERKCLLHP